MEGNIMSDIKGTRHVLAVPDLKASLSYFTEVLGFHIVEEPPGWAFIRRGALFLMLGECKEATPPRELGDHSYFAYVDVEDAEKLHEEFERKGTKILKPPTAEPWHMKEFAIETIDGHRMMFGEYIGPDS